MVCNIRRWAVLVVSLPLLLPNLVVAAGDDTSATTNQHRLEAMSDAEKTEFLRKKRRFDELTSEEQARLRSLYAQLQADPNRDRLIGVLQRFGEWLKTLPPGERAQLLSLPPAERVARIKEIQNSREERRFNMMVDGRLGKSDLKAILKWVGEYVRRHKDKILALIPTSFRPSEDALREMSDASKQRMLGFVLLRNSSSFTLSPDDTAQLRSTISHDAQEFLDKLEGDENRTRVLWSWIRAALFSRMRPPVSPEALREFFLEKLEPEKREYLEGLPRDQMLRELQDLYWREASRGQRRWRPGGPGGPGGPGKRPGPGGPGGRSGFGPPRSERGKR